ncbi:MAG TPA: 2-hydroxyacid dehydrogenase, partial [Mycobacterium sp.]|nr:2-hydroxyacid dehydrogenase [Mycobacterium sp.]
MTTSSGTRQSRSVLQVGPLKPSLAQTLRDDYAAYVLPDEPAQRDTFLSSHGTDITAVVTSGRSGVDAALMSALPNLGAVVNFGVGYDTTDVDAAAERGVAVSNTPDVLTD